ncbi:MAG TPA: glycoside hydrolase family 97 protein [Puia sp.]
MKEQIITPAARSSISRTVIAITLLLPFLTTFSAHAQKNLHLFSPDKTLSFDLKLTDTALLYSVTYKGKSLIDHSPLSLSFQDQPNLQQELAIDKPITRHGEEDYSLIVGKTSHVHDQYKELTVPLREKKSPFRQIRLVVRAFNTGLAFRYEFPEQKGWANLKLTAENTGFHLHGDPTVRALLLPNFTSSHEGKYTILPLHSLKEDTLMDMPALFEFPGGIYMAITEAALLDYAGMYLVKHGGTLTSRLSPLPGSPGDSSSSGSNPPRGPSLCVESTLPHQSPWRVLLISDRVGALIESNMITDLCPPRRISDISWIRPGKTTFPWWNGNVTPDTLNAPGNNFVTQQYYIDFCARAGLEYHSVVEYGLHEWYVNDGAGFTPGPHADPTHAVPGLDMKAVCDYAHSKGVGIRVWVHWAALYPRLDSAFAQFERWGISGMMVDFMDRDDQQMVNIQTEILEKAALHHLHIQFHGAYKPTGLSRTYPNEFTREGTLNYEVNKWDKKIDPDHDINIPFTRMLAGPTDYHLGGFRAVPDSLFVVQYTRPLMMGTRCHMLAMYVVLESYLGMVCDYPAAYEGQPGFEFLQKVPTVWDETRVLDAAVGKYVVIARRKGNDWFIGGITNHEGRQLEIPMTRLEIPMALPDNSIGGNSGNSGGNGGAKYNATIYSDAADTRTNPNHLDRQSRNLTRTDSLSVIMAPGGGWAAHLKRLP